MKKVLDIYRQLKSEIDIRNKENTNYKIETSKLGKNSLNDIYKKLKKIDLSEKKHKDITKLNSLKVKKNYNYFNKIVNFCKSLFKSKEKTKLESKNQEIENLELEKKDTVITKIIKQIKKYLKYLAISNRIKKVNGEIKKVNKELQIKDDSQNFTKNKKIKFSVKLKKILEKIKLIIQKRKTTFTHKPIINKQTIKKEETKNKNKKFWSFKKIYTKRTVFYSGLVFLCISIFLYIDKIIIETQIHRGYEKIILIKNNPTDIELMTKNINDSKFNFIFGDILFKPFLLIPNKQIKNGYFILKGGKKLTKFLDKSIQTYNDVKSIIDTSKGLENIEITNILYNLRGDFFAINNLLHDTIVTYDKIKDFSNDELSEKLDIALAKMKQSYKLLSILNRDYDIFLDILGHTKEKKYLLVFQNNDEIRPTGGFMGSLATVTIKSGKVLDFHKEDIYAYEWEINKNYTEKIPAPEGLNKITENFGLRDSNYFVNIDDSSWSIYKFLKMINKDIDGVVYINQNTILDFLELIGPIKFDQIDEIITQDNFSMIISTLVEAKIFKVGTLGTPKQILFDFSELFLAKIKEKKDYKGYLDIIFKNIKSRDLIFYSFNSEENNLLWKLGLNGKINYANSLDFNYPIYTSIGGNKSDRYLDLKYKKNITRNADCSIDTKLEIIRSHTFTNTEEKQVNDLLNKYKSTDNRENIINIQGRGDNKSFTRILLPRGVIVKEKPNLKVSYHPKLTVVEIYMTTRLRETNSYELEYTIANKKCDNYSFKFYKQPGIRNYDIEINKDSVQTKENNIKTDFVFPYKKAGN